MHKLVLLRKFAHHSPNHLTLKDILGLWSRDEYLSVEEELQYLYPRERLPIFPDGCGVKGPLFDRNIHREKIEF